MNLYQHQQEALQKTEGRDHVGYFLDMGLGKTYIGAEKLVRLREKVNLVICQKSKVDDWVNHFRTEYSEKCCMDVWDLTKKQEYESFWVTINDLHLDHITNTAVINYELAWRRKELLKLQDFTLLLDESSLIQNRRAKQTKFILNLRPKNVILLSGTPVGGKYENLWTQLHLLGWNITESLYERQYVNWKKLEVAGVIHNIVDKDDPYKNVDRLKRKMRDHGSVFQKTEEVFDLPEKVFQTVYCQTSPEYKHFWKHGIVNIHTGTSGPDTDDDVKELVGDTSLTKLLYLRQLCGQYSKDKLDAFRDLLLSTNERLVVFYNFNDELALLKTICESEGRAVSEINGTTKDLTAYETVKDSVTLVQYQAGAMGLNLQKACRIVYYTLPLSSEKFEQSKKRIHRIGQTHTCFYYLLICRSSIEESIYQSLQERRDYTDELFREENNR